MNCTEAQELIHRAIDGELDADARRTLDAHLQSCAACSAYYAEQRALLELLVTQAPDFRASKKLRTRIESHLPGGKPARALHLPAPGWWSAVAAACLAVALTWGLEEHLRAIDSQESFKDDAVAVHRRSLQERHLLDVAAAQPAQLQAWFRQRLPYPVPVRDFSARGYALVGGRVDYLYEQAVAAVVYRRGGHLINVLIWPFAPSDRFPSAALNEDRLTVQFFRKGDTNFCVISDLAAEEFNQFTDLLASA